MHLVTISYFYIYLIIILLFFVKKDWHERALVFEIENNITKILVFLQLGCGVEITMTKNFFTCNVNSPV